MNDEDFLEFAEEEEDNDPGSQLIGLSEQVSSAFLSACQYATKCNQGVRYSVEENRTKTSILRSVLLQKGFSVTTIRGTYKFFFETESEIELEVTWFLVLNICRMNTFREVITDLAKSNEQEYFEFQDPRKPSYVMTGNDCLNNHFGKGKLGKIKNTGESLVKSIISLSRKQSVRQTIQKPLIFESIGEIDERWSNFSREEKHEVLMDLLD